MEKVNSTAYTREINTASMLLTLGFKLREHEPVTRIVKPSGSTQDTFYFEPIGKTEFGEIPTCLAMYEFSGINRNSAIFRERYGNAYQVIDYMSKFVSNRNELIAAVKNKVIPQVAHNVGGNVLFLPLNASPEVIETAKRMVKEAGR